MDINIHQWQRQEYSILMAILVIKYQTCQSFFAKLIQSGTVDFLHTVADTRWGIGIDTNEVQHPVLPSTVKGQNMHGKALMEIRNSMQTRLVMAPPPQQQPQTGMRADTREAAQQHQDAQVARQGMESLPKQAWNTRSQNQLFC